MRNDLYLDIFRNLFRNLLWEALVNDNDHDTLVGFCYVLLELQVQIGHSRG